MKPTWQKLNRIRKLNVYKFASWAIVLVPILASAHIALREHAHINLPLPTNLFFTYLSTMLFVLASLLIDVYCPNEIKDHADFEAFFQFVAHKTETASLARRASISRREELLDRISSEGFPERELSGTQSSQLPSLLESFFSEEGDKAFLAAATEAWDKADESRPYIRCLTTLAFALSAAVALYVTFYDAPRRVLTALV